MDDGPAEWDKSIKMLHRAVEDGITAITATPHVRPGLYDSPKETVLALVEELKKRAHFLPIEIYPGSELTISQETLTGIKKKKYCSINLGRYVLVELPGHFDPEKIYDFIFAITSRGMVPVIAHPERNGKVASDVDVLYEMVRLGALTQITAASLTGLFGNATRRFSCELISRKLAHVIASDAHDHGHRAPVLSAALAKVTKLAGSRAALAMVRETPEKIVTDEAIDADEPLYVKKRNFFFFRL